MKYSFRQEVFLAERRREVAGFGPRFLTTSVNTVVRIPPTAVITAASIVPSDEDAGGAAKLIPLDELLLDEIAIESANVWITNAAKNNTTTSIIIRGALCMAARLRNLISTATLLLLP
jgi:hypothetical protein